ncbi:MAG TPA: hypothetical protein VMG10_23360 [Gemmataceae bacterium]|nr:hypothetical protein [Gemmataceae bacterium]
MANGKSAEFGDFQTPPELASSVCALLSKQGVKPASLVEPTCGLGSFLFAGLDYFRGLQNSIGADINARYIEKVTDKVRRRGGCEWVKVAEADFFRTDWEQVISQLPEPVLILGNPPWVTNAHLGTLGSQNLPAKSNFQKQKGLDAITGKANFDISEWMLMQLVEAMNGRHGTLAMLCKAAVARKVLHHAWKNGLSTKDSTIYRIDSGLHFGASVDAALLVTHFRSTGEHDLQAKVYPHLSNAYDPTVIGYEDGLLLADLGAYRRWRHLNSPKKDQLLRWRSGIKHDCSKVMELRKQANGYGNGLGESIELEDTYLYPMLKSSGVARRWNGNDLRYMIVTQRSVGEDTAIIEQKAPLTWAYLLSHAHLFHKRSSSIYRDRPAFAIFGVGEYTFARWKVAISGFYKKLQFTVIGPVDEKPVVLDDTCYFLACDNEEQTAYLASILNSPVAEAFYGSFIFWDNKRPITAELLGRLDLQGVARELGSEAEFRRFFAKPKDREAGFWQIWDSAPVTTPLH